MTVTEPLNTVAKENDAAFALVPAEFESGVTTPPNELDGEPFSPSTLVTAVEIFSFLDLEFERFKEVLKRLPVDGDRDKEETFWLFSLGSAFKGAMRLISARKGFLLMFLKATSPKGRYQKRAAELFPGSDDRTCRYYVAQSRLSAGCSAFELRDGPCGRRSFGGRRR